MEDRLGRVLAEIDAINAGDPKTIEARGRSGPKELLHSQLVTEWVERLVEDPSEALRIAARGHHLRRWSLPRADFPAGRGGYLRWRKELQGRHASEVGAVMARLGYTDEQVARVQELIRKRGLGRDPEVQALEDAMCLVFLETQLADVAAKLETGKLVDVLRKTLRKMSERGIARATELELSAEGRALLQQAMHPDVS